MEMLKDTVKLTKMYMPHTYCKIDQSVFFNCRKRSIKQLENKNTLWYIYLRKACNDNSTLVG